MTIASEITRLQGAKASAKTSIENKGVTVPSNATIDTYHNYIDLIDTGAMFMDKLTLKNHVVDLNDSTPRIGGFISWSDNTGYYGASVLTTEKSSGQSAYYYYLMGIKKTTGSDIEYYQGYTTGGTGIYGFPANVKFYRKEGFVRTIFYVDSTYTTNWRFWHQYDWDLSTNTISETASGRTEGGTTPPSPIDTTGFVEFTTSSWIDTITGTNDNDDSNIYLTLK